MKIRIKTRWALAIAAVTALAMPAITWAATSLPACPCSCPGCPLC